MGSLIAWGTLTNYIKIVLRIIIGLVTFRLLYGALDQASFGLYQLLWSTVGYVVLLDFGFGFAVQKSVARAVGSGQSADVEAAQIDLSTVLTGLILIAAGLLAVIALLVGPALFSGELFAQDQQLDDSAPVAITIFIVGVAMAFPLGLSREILRGAGLLHRANVYDCCGIIAQGVVLSYGCLQQWPLAVLMLAATCCTLAPLIGMTWEVCKDPRWRPQLRLVRLKRLGSLAGLGVSAFIITMTNIIMGQTDQLLIGSLISLTAVALYVQV